MTSYKKTDRIYNQRLFLSLSYDSLFYIYHLCTLIYWAKGISGSIFNFKINKFFFLKKKILIPYHQVLRNLNLWKKDNFGQQFSSILVFGSFPLPHVYAHNPILRMGTRKAVLSKICVLCPPTSVICAAFYLQLLSPIPEAPCPCPPSRKLLTDRENSQVFPGERE